LKGTAVQRLAGVVRVAPRITVLVQVASAPKPSARVRIVYVVRNKRVKTRVISKMQQKKIAASEKRKSPNMKRKKRKTRVIRIRSKRPRIQSNNKSKKVQQIANASKKTWAS